MELLFAIVVHNRDDMETAENFIKCEVGSKHTQRCSFLRSMEYMKIRLHALYAKPTPQALTAYCKGLKIVFTPERRLEIWTCHPVPDVDPRVLKLRLGKRCADDDAQHESPPCSSSGP